MKTKKVLISILCIALAAAAVAGCVTLVGLFKSDDNLKVISPSFEVGGLTDTGKHLDTKMSIYTKESFECKCLEITPDFDAAINYQVFFYTETNNFISSSGVLTEGQKINVPSAAQYARLVITPIWDSGVEVEDKELNILDVWKYSRQLTIKVLDVNKMSDKELYAPIYGENFRKDYADLSAEGRAENNFNNIDHDAGTVAYADRTLFDNKCITKIDIPVATVSAVNDNQFFTIFVAKDSAVVQGGKIDSTNSREYKIYIPKEKIKSTQVDSWMSIDLTEYNICVDADETLAFLFYNDTVGLYSEAVGDDEEIAEKMFCKFGEGGAEYSGHFYPFGIYGYSI